MKKTLLLLFILIGLSLPVFSQGFKGKLITGLNASQIDGDGMSGFHKPGLLFGLAAEYRINDKWSFQPEVLYSQKGARTSQAALDKDPYLVRQTYRLNYADIPLIFTLNQFKEITFHFGPSVGVLVGAKYDDGAGFFDIRDRINTLDFLGNAGAEYRLSPRFNFNIRYSYSIWPMGDGPVTNLWVASGRNNTLSFSLRYSLNLFENE